MYGNVVQAHEPATRTSSTIGTDRMTPRPRDVPCVFQRERRAQASEIASAIPSTTVRIMSAICPDPYDDGAARNTIANATYVTTYATRIVRRARASVGADADSAARCLSTRSRAASASASL